MYRLKVQHILYLIAVVFGVIGFLNFQSSMRTSSYEKVSGYITDVEETSELTKAGEYYGAAEPLVRCGESHLSGLTEPLRSLV